MAVKITQCHGHMPLSGRRFGSFADKEIVVVTDHFTASQFTDQQERQQWRHQFPPSGSQMGLRPHHHSFSLFPRLRPAGA